MSVITSVFGKDATIIRKRDFQVLLVASMLPVLGSALLSPVLDSLIEPFGATSATIGLVISFFTAPAIVMIPVAGTLADRYSRKLVLLSSILLFGISGTAIAFTTDFRVLLALRILQGIGFAGIAPIIITIVGDLFTGAEETTGQGLRFMVSGFSGAVFPLLAGWLVVVSWQYPFLIYTISFPIAIGVYLWYEEPNPLPSSNTPKNVKSTSYLGDLFRLVRHRRVLAFVMARALMSAVWLGFVTYNSLIVARLIGGTPVEAGLLATVGFLVFAVAGSQAGRITSFVRSRYYVLIGANASLGAGFAGILFADDIFAAMIGITVCGIGFGLLGSMYRSIVTGFAPPHLRGGLVSLSEAAGRVASTLTPLAMGGIIAVTEPTLGPPGALRGAGLLVAILGGGGGILCVVIARISAPVTVDTAD